jgi:hypothetical protein
LSLPVFEERMRIVRFITVSEMSRWFYTHHELNPASQQSFEAMVADVAAFVTAGLAAPASAPVSASASV